MDGIFKWFPRPRRSSSAAYRTLPTTSEGSRDDVLLRTAEEEFLSKQEPSSPTFFDSRGFSLSSVTTSSVFHKTLLLIKAFLIYLIPSFVHNITASTNAPRRKIPPTAYLNGVRGLAAFFVFCQHWMTYFYGLDPMWGYGAREKDVWVAQLPFVRLVHSGRYCVAIFYVLSGYVLGYKPLQLIRQGDIPGLSNNLISGIFRRGLRLFLPLIAPLMVASFMVWAGWYGTPEGPMTGKTMSTISPDGTLWGEFWKTLRTFDRVLNPFSHDIVYPRNIPALYTLRVEFRGSILIFTMVLGLAKAKPIMRMLIMSTVAIYSLLHTRWDAFLFLSGVVLAEFGHIRNASTLSLGDFINNLRLLRLIRFMTSIFWISVLIFSMFLGSFPRFSAHIAPGYKTLCKLAPDNYHSDDGYASFWCSIAAVLLLAALENFPVLQKPFATAFARYMGDISFSIYVFHVPTYLTIGRVITVSLIKSTGQYNLGFVLGGMFLVPILICVADLQWRAFDLNSVKVARWLEVKIFS